MTPETLILSVLSESEAKAIKCVFGLDGNEAENDNVNCIYPIYYYSNNKSVIISFIINKGNPDAAIATTYLVDSFKPKKAILVGTCAGRPDKTKAGDVIISSRGVFDYGQSGLAFGQDNELRFRGFNPSPELSRRFSFLNSDKDLKTKWWPTILSHALTLNVADLGAINTNLFDQAIASGAQIIDESSMKILTDANNNIYAADQESFGFASACEEKKVDWIVVRGVSDCGNRDDRKKQAVLATISAATLVKLFLDNDTKPVELESTSLNSLIDEPLVESIVKIRNLLGCSHVWIPTKEHENEENESRNQKKLSEVKASCGSVIRLLAITGYSFLCNRGVFFNSIFNHLKNGGTFNILLSSQSTGSIILNKEEVVNRNAKYQLATAGYKELKNKFGDLIHLRTIDFDLPATLLITKDKCFFEPYTHIPSLRDQNIFVSFEMLLSKEISEHGYGLMLDYFNHLFLRGVDLP